MDSRFTRMEVKATDDAAHTVDLRILSYGTVDTFGTMWEPGCVDETLTRGYLPLAFSHSWDEPIGHMLERLPDDEQGPVVRFQFDDFDAVPRARQVYAQMSSGTLRDCSIGFSGWTRRDPSDGERAALVGVRDIVSSVRLDEVSVVLRGAVKDATMVGLRHLAELAKDVEIKESEEEHDIEPERIDYTEAEALIDEALYNLGS